MPPDMREGGGLHCDRCGSEQLVPLSAPVYRRKTGYLPDEALVRPVSKCVGCGERIYAVVLYRERTLRQG